MSDKTTKKTPLSHAQLQLLRYSATNSLHHEQIPGTLQGLERTQDINEVIEELRIYHAELEVQNHELQNALNSVDQIKAHYLQLFDENPLPSLILDSKGVIHELNKAAMTLLKLVYPTNRKRSLYRYLTLDTATQLVELLGLNQAPLSQALKLTIKTPELASFDCVLTHLEGEDESPFLLIMRDTQAESALARERELFNQIVNNSSDIIFVIDAQLNLVAGNHLAQQYLQLVNQVILPVNIRSTLPSEIIEVSTFLFEGAGQHAEHTFNFKLPRSKNSNEEEDNHLFHCRLFKINTEPDDHDPLLGVMLTDETENLRSQMQLDLAAEIFKESMQAIMITQSNGDIVYVNRAFETITGYPSKEILGQNPRLLSSGTHRNAFYTLFWQQLTKKGHWAGEIWNRRKSGEAYPQWLNINKVSYGEDDFRYVALFNDISDQKNAEKRIKSLAYHDQLTGVGNRNLLVETLNEKTSADTTIDFCLMFIDLDYFKHVNDAHGHDTGDLLLKQVGRRLKNIKRESDHLFRIGGDEFVIIFEHISPSQVADRANTINQALESPFFIKGHQLMISCSIGMAFYPNDAADTESLLKYADIAMYSSKKAGRNRFHFYDPTLSHAVERNVAIEQGLKHALSRGELSFATQSLHDLNNQHVVSQELLLRWPHSDIDHLSIEELIGVAEENGILIQSITLLAIEAGLALIEHNLSNHLKVRVGVNLSGNDFTDKDHFNRIVHLCADHSTEAAYLDIEVTERTLMRDPVARREQLEQLRQLGIRILIDDFGTGYSSFAYLRDFPVDALKIDQSFVKYMMRSPNDLAIIKTIVGLGKNLQLEVIAEGVETAEQAEMLKEIGCDNAQGYFFSKPTCIT